MAYEKELDQQLFSETAELETSKITVSVFSYNGGTQKVQLSRENLDPNTGKFKWSKLGRLIKEEAELVAPILVKAVATME
ncbi:hypothetical protein HOD20_03545 [archaeon]|jgi:hypothetical protein|nr:hypothetical protein [archaeon]MBT4351576.1 hypothetical protein [archaeon]MBT4648606.1 hypothetical protein [archaeon]MBT6821436.1 hypothetical protein [archaeon]MBT7393030.1 hypothetical protein [archaeon]